MTENDKALVKLLRVGDQYEVGAVSHEAADRIEALSAENERLRDILEQWLETAREYLDTEVAGRTFEALERAK